MRIAVGRGATGLITERSTLRSRCASRAVLGKWCCFLVMDTRKSLGGGCLDEEMVTVVVWDLGVRGIAPVRTPRRRTN